MLNQELENKLDLIVDQIDNCSDYDELDIVADRYDRINHPHAGFKFGEAYLSFNQKPSAFDYLAHSASFCIEGNTEWSGTGYANSIGHSLFYLLTMYRFQSSSNNILFKMYANAYIFLSICISNMKDDAYDSCRTRAKLIDASENTVGIEVIKKYYYSGNDLCKEILSIGDYSLASMGLRKHNLTHDAAICRDKSVEYMNEILKLPNYQTYRNIGLDQLTQISLKNSEFFFKNLITAHKNGELYISLKEWKEIEKSQSRSAGIGMWI